MRAPGLHSAFKLMVRTADIKKMDSMKCAACGVDLPDAAARFCSSCGEPVLIPDDGPTADPSPPSRITDEHWQYITWGAIAAGAIAIVALVAVVFGLLSGTDTAGAVDPGATDEVVPTSVTVPEKALESINVPVTEPVVVRSPRIGPTTRYHQDGTVVVVRVTMDVCERHDGMLRTSGSIRNDSALDQTFDYDIGVDLKRRGTGAVLSHLVASVEGLASGETAEWNVETVSSRVVNIRCDVTELTVIPVDES
ncbi:MAG: hypothetical protein DRJ50_08880 [Actinobacteria bacterium]|nr:MAG: hypothetical protein DRJ50_08880 [Actinomycetota bacterium]